MFLPMYKSRRFLFNMNFNLAVFVFLWSKPETCDGIPSVTALILEHGYPAETHKVITEDSYILTMHRIPYGANDNLDYRKGVVILLHGLHLSSADWLFIGPNNALPFLLADAGYDVWLSNSRGNDQSQEHLSLDPTTSTKYWNFSWYEMGIYDLPAIINYTLSKTGETNLTLVGHSQGCTETFIAGIFHPYLFRQIKILFALAPAAYMGGTQSLYLRSIADVEPILREEAESLGYYKVSPTDGFIKKVIGVTCSNFVPVTPELCWLILAYAIDASLSGTNKTILQTVLQYTPSSISIKQDLHYGQCINCHCFRQYHNSLLDFDLESHTESLYYNLSQILFPIYIFYAENDKVTVPSDVRRTRSELGNCVGERFIEDPDFAHMDFLYGINVTDLVYIPLMKEM